MHNNMNVNVSGPVQPSSQYKTIVLKGNLPFASQVTEPNTKYIIKHDFILGEDITVPANCVLEFDGGSVSGDGADKNTITGTDTEIVNGNFSSIILGGTLKNREIHTDWFNINDDVNNVAKNNESIAALVSIANSMALPGVKLVIDRDIAISITITITKCSLVCNGKILFYAPVQTGIIFNYGGGASNRLVLDSVIDIEYRSLAADITFEDFVSLNVVGLKLVKTSSSYVSFNIKNISNFTVGINLAPLGDNGVSANFKHITIFNSYIGIKFDKGEGWTNFSTFKTGVVSNFSNFCAYNKNIGIGFYFTNSAHPYGGNQFYNISLDGSKIAIYAERYVANSIFYNIRCEGVETLIHEEGDMYMPDPRVKSILIPDSPNRGEDAPYQSFRIEYKNPNYFFTHSYDIIGVCKNTDFASCNLPLAAIGSSTALGDVINISHTIDRGFSYSNNLLTFTSALPCIIIDVENNRNINLQFLLKAKDSATFTIEQSIFVAGADSDFKKLNISSDYTNTINRATTNLRSVSTEFVNGFGISDIEFRNLYNENETEETKILKYLIICFRSNPKSVKVLSEKYGADNIFCDVRNRLDCPANPNYPYSSTDIDFTTSIFRTDINKPIYWDGTTWVDGDGFTPTKTTGPTIDRPKLIGEENGVLRGTDLFYRYFDSTLLEDVFANIYTGDSILNQSIDAVSDYIGENVMASGKMYNIRFSSTGLTLYASKVNTNPQESDLLELVKHPGGTNVYTQSITAPDKTIYPYIYITNIMSAARSVKISNINLSWIDSRGFTAGPNRGGTNKRPTGNGATGGILDATRDIGYEYFDTTLGKPIYAKTIAGDGTVTWVDATGTSV